MTSLSGGGGKRAEIQSDNKYWRNYTRQAAAADFHEVKRTKENKKREQSGAGASVTDTER